MALSTTRSCPHVQITQVQRRDNIGWLNVSLTGQMSELYISGGPSSMKTSSAGLLKVSPQWGRSTCRSVMVKERYPGLLQRILHRSLLQSFVIQHLIEVKHTTYQALTYSPIMRYQRCLAVCCEGLW